MLSRIDNNNTNSSADGVKSTSPKERIMISNFFDEDYYGLEDDRELSVDHYMSVGEALGRKPSAYFDPEFYQAAYPDVADAKSGLLDHYILYGRAEGRFPTFAILAADATRLEEAKLFDAKLYRRSRQECPGYPLTDAEHYLLFGIRRGIPPIHSFDIAFYTSTYPDAVVNPLIHYINIGKRQRRYTNKDQFYGDITCIQSQFDASYYLEQTNDPAALVDPVRHYLARGVLDGLAPSPDFNAAFYEERYPDIAKGPMLPFAHYAQFGRNEGREGRPRVAERLKVGGRYYDSDLPTLVIANHESSRTGAPLVGLALARRFGDTHNIVTLLGRDREISADFVEASCAIFVGHIPESEARWLFQELVDKYKVQAVITNSVETRDFAVAADQAGLPVVSLIHEFAEYTFPRGKLADVVASADRVIVPAELIRKSVEKDTLIHLGASPSNILVKAQGYLTQPPLKRRGNDLTPEELRAWIAERSGLKAPRVVLGAGYAQIRKGTDLFIQTAAALKRLDDNVVFLWVGEGYDPGTDPAFSVYLKAMVERSGVADRMFFLGAQQRIDDILAVADVFYLPSRMDPFPNVVIDAMNACLPVVCFDQGTGSAEIFADKHAVGSVLPYADVDAAAKAISDYVRNSKRYPQNSELIKRQFDFDEYVSVIREQIDIATQLRSNLKKVIERVSESGTFDAEFHAGTNLPYSAMERERSAYVRRAARGFVKFSPKPGFSDGMYKVSKGLAVEAPVCALDLALQERGDQQALRTHDSYDLALLSPARHRLRTAIHLHVHYPDTLPYFLDPIEKLGMSVDLYVTTTGPVNRLRVEAGLLDYERGSVSIAEGPNRGRDIGPFMTLVGDMIGDKEYDLIGHFHGKKSLSSGEAMGRNWRDFLLGTLLGEPGDISRIFALFAADEKLGLVFAEDRHAVGWSENRAIAESIAARMKPRPILSDFSVFPLGNMFWARPDAVRPLWTSNFKWDDYPIEPILDDGTILHAVERMLPGICESVGMRWATVYKNGLSW